MFIYCIFFFQDIVLANDSIQISDIDEINILQCNNNQEHHFIEYLNDISNKDNMLTITKERTIRKRKIYSTPLVEYKKLKKEQIRNKYKLKPPCVTCRKQCLVHT